MGDDIPLRYSGPVALLYEGAREPAMFALSLNSLLMSVRTEFSERIRSMVVRRLPSVSSGVLGSSALFCAWSIRVCSWTMGRRSSTCSRAVRIVMLGTFASDGIEREELSDRYGPA
jgi:hypothetical protein